MPNLKNLKLKLAENNMGSESIKYLTESLNKLPINLNKLSLDLTHPYSRFRKSNQISNLGDCLKMLPSNL